MTTAPQEPHRQRYLTIDSCHDCSNRMEMVCLYKPLGMIPMPNGKEAFDYRNRYVCTEKDDREIDNDLPDWCPLPAHPAAPVPDVEYEGLKLLDELYRYACINTNGQGFSSGVDEFREIKIKEYKSRSHTSAPTDEQCRICSAAIAKAEQERVLDEYAAWDDTRWTTGRVREFKARYLRQPEEP